MAQSHTHTVYDILRKPVISEKSMTVSADGCYVFDVLPDATKPEIWNAVESIFGVKVQSLRTLNRKGKEKRFRGRLGMRGDVKRAFVRLEQGHTLDVLPN